MLQLASCLAAETFVALPDPQQCALSVHPIPCCNLRSLSRVLAAAMYACSTYTGQHPILSCVQPGKINSWVQHPIAMLCQ